MTKIKKQIGSKIVFKDLLSAIMYYNWTMDFQIVDLKEISEI